MTSDSPHGMIWLSCPKVLTATSLFYVPHVVSLRLTTSSFQTATGNRVAILMPFPPLSPHPQKLMAGCIKDRHRRVILQLFFPSPGIHTWGSISVLGIAFSY